MLSLADRSQHSLLYQRQTTNAAARAAGRDRASLLRHRRYDERRHPAPESAQCCGVEIVGTPATPAITSTLMTVGQHARLLTRGRCTSSWMTRTSSLPRDAALNEQAR
jgi:hypothetical protein